VQLLACLCVAIAQPAFAADEPLLKVGTETPAPGERRPSEELVRVVVGAIQKDEIEQLDDCLSEQGFERADYASLLRAVKINAGTGGNLWFVRPARKPYCLALYGAHLFRYFWIEEQQSTSGVRYRLLFQNGGDVFAVYQQQSHGLNDIEATGCIASECRSARMSFDGRQYRPVRCTRTTYGGGREVTKERRCGSDEWRDDQASGFARPSGE
jgi:hypothetical protein